MGSSQNLVADHSGTVLNDGGATTDADYDISKEDDPFDLPPPRPSQTSPFQEGEKVLAYHNQIIYEAKIMNVVPDLNGGRYSVHYHGWSKSWDEEVGMDRLMKYTKENVEKQQEHNEMQEKQNNTKPWNKSKSSTGATGKKRKRGSVQKEKAMPLMEKRVNIHIPPGLKKQLIDDWERVTHLGKLVKLPTSPNVDEILSKYHEYRLKKDARLVGSVGEVVNGLRRYFDKALPAMLLYKNERQQYEEAIAENMAPSTVYGAEHLLRLFVKMPDLLHGADIEETMLIELQEHLGDFTKFLQKNQSSFFLGAQLSSGISTIKKQEK